MLEDLETAASIAESLVTAIAIVVGGVWAYIRFVRERTYRPHLELTVDAERVTFAGRSGLLCTTVVRNIGAIQLDLVEKGSALIVATALPAGLGTIEQVEWRRDEAVPVLPQHAWIEPREVVSHQELIAVPSEDNEPHLVEARLGFRRGDETVYAFANCVVPPGAPTPEGGN